MNISKCQTQILRFYIFIFSFPDLYGVNSEAPHQNFWSSLFEFVRNCSNHPRFQFLPHSYLTHKRGSQTVNLPTGLLNFCEEEIAGVDSMSYREVTVAFKMDFFANSPSAVRGCWIGLIACCLYRFWFKRGGVWWEMGSLLRRIK